MQVFRQRVTGRDETEVSSDDMPGTAARKTGGEPTDDFTTGGPCHCRRIARRARFGGAMRRGSAEPTRRAGRKEGTGRSGGSSPNPLAGASPVRFVRAARLLRMERVPRQEVSSGSGRRSFVVERPKGSPPFDELVRERSDLPRSDLSAARSAWPSFLDPETTACRPSIRPPCARSSPCRPALPRGLDRRSVRIVTEASARPDPGHSAGRRSRWQR